MRLLIKVYADDLRSACTTCPLYLKVTSLSDLTLGQLKVEI